MIDMFSRWPEAFATLEKSGDSVAKIFLQEIFPRLTTVRCILFDWGTEYMNEVIDLITANLGVRRVSTLPYSPWSS